MELQYVSDENGHPTAVIVPIEDLNKITFNQKEVTKKKITKKKLAEFRGIFSKEEGERFNAYIKQARSE